MEGVWKGPLLLSVPQREEEMVWKTGILGRNLRKWVNQGPGFPLPQKPSKLLETPPSSGSLCFSPVSPLWYNQCKWPLALGEFCPVSGRRDPESQEAPRKEKWIISVSGPRATPTPVQQLSGWGEKSSTIKERSCLRLRGCPGVWALPILTRPRGKGNVLGLCPVLSIPTGTSWHRCNSLPWVSLSPHVTQSNPSPHSSQQESFFCPDVYSSDCASASISGSLDVFGGS